jgi:hypothetical protein
MLNVSHDPIGTPTWQIDDVRAIDFVSGLNRHVTACCGFCGSEFTAHWYVLLSVAREGGGGQTLALCDSCTHAHWSALQERLQVVATMLVASDLLRAQTGP